MRKPTLQPRRLTRILLIPLVLLAFGACKKSSPAVRGNGCISQVGYRFETLLSAAEDNAVKHLFSMNNLSTAGLSFHSYDTIAPSYDSAIHTLARADTYMNGLPVIYGDRIYRFTDNVYDSSSSGPNYSSGVDTASTRDLPGLQALFLKHVHECIIVSFNNDPHATGPSADDYKNTCLKASKVYMDKAGVPGSKATSGESLLLAWRITPADGEAPLVYVEDDNGEAWGVPMGYQ